MNRYHCVLSVATILLALGITVEFRLSAPPTESPRVGDP